MGMRPRRIAWPVTIIVVVLLLVVTRVSGEPAPVGRRALREDKVPVPIRVTGDNVVVVSPGLKPGLADDDGVVETTQGGSVGAGKDSTKSDSATQTTSDASSSSETTTDGGSADEIMLRTGIDPKFVQRVAGGSGCVVVTWANDHYRDFARSWVGNLKQIGITNYMVGAMDEDLFEYLNDEKINTWLMGSRGIEKSKVKADFGWGSKNFHKMGRDKIRLIRDFTLIGFDVLISDIDVAWLRDPVPFFRQFPGADMLVSTDQLRSETAMNDDQVNFTKNGIAKNIARPEGLEFHVCHASLNIGMMWFRSTSGSRNLTDTWVKLIEEDDKLWDQNAFNDLVRAGKTCAGRSDPAGSGLYKAWDDQITIGALPASTFANGHVFHVQKTHSRADIQLDPYAVHNTFQYGGTPGKRHRMREANVWRGEDFGARFLLESDDGDEPPLAGFLSYTPKIPADVDLGLFAARSWPVAKDDTFPSIETINDPLVAAHAALVEYQLKQLRVAVALATKLHRVVIAPPILCGLDRVWYPHFGRFPGSEFALPFVCPLDHVLAVERSTKMNLLREFTFLSHPELPSAIRTSVAVVDVEGDDDGDSDDGVEFPRDVKQCATGPGTGSDSGNGTETCGWLGVSRDVSIGKRRAVVSSTSRDPESFANAIAQVRSSAVVHFSSVTPLMAGRKGHAGWEPWYEHAKEVVPPDAWCCAKDGHKQFEVE